MSFVKFCLAALLFFFSVLIGLFFGLGGLWSALAFALFAPLVTFWWRSRGAGGRDRVYFVTFFLSLVLEVVLLALFIQGQWLGMHRIMDGYDAPSSTQALIALAPLVFYVACLSRWAAGGNETNA